MSTDKIIIFIVFFQIFGFCLFVSNILDVVEKIKELKFKELTINNIFNIIIFFPVIIFFITIEFICFIFNKISKNKKW